MTIHVYYPLSHNRSISAQGFPIGEGGLAFNGRNIQLDALVVARMIRRVDVHNVTLPNGIHVLNVTHDKWADSTFRFSSSSRKSVMENDANNENVLTVGAPSDSPPRTSVPQRPVQRNPEIGETVGHNTSFINNDPRTLTVQRQTTPQTMYENIAGIDPNSGLPIMGNALPPPDLNAEVDPVDQQYASDVSVSVKDDTRQTRARRNP